MLISWNIKSIIKSKFNLRKLNKKNKGIIKMVKFSLQQIEKLANDWEIEISQLKSVMLENGTKPNDWETCISQAIENFEATNGPAPREYLHLKEHMSWTWYRYFTLRNKLDGDKKLKQSLETQILEIQDRIATIDADIPETTKIVASARSFAEEAFDDYNSFCAQFSDDAQGVKI